ncbi:MAG: class I SAM-dependent methyltransferase [Anaerolineales bacterium]|nr:class I SAM-dependent methyltransferase [Anaerolineales bacterium]
MSARITLHEKAAKSIGRRHPWFFSGAIKSIKGSPEAGDILQVLTPEGQFAARGYWNPNSQIAIRVLSWQDENINRDFWLGRIRQAIHARGGQPVCRLINAENDYLPGLIVDRYGEWLVLQALTLGIDQRKQMLAALLAEELQPRGIYERSDVDVRSKEGLSEVTGVLWGEEPPDSIEITEHGWRLLVDIKTGQKTGFYLDQRDNRADLYHTLQTHPAEVVLNAFSYTGGFTVAGLAGGAQRVISLDSSEGALELAKQNVALNGFAVNDEDFVVGDVFATLRQYRDAGQTFDAIVLDPPKFAHNASQIDRAARGYKDINLFAIHQLKPGGLLWTFSCSGVISADLFQKIVFGALVDSGREGQIIRRLTSAADHPVALTFPEGDYLKGLVCRVW